VSAQDRFLSQNSNNDNNRNKKRVNQQPGGNSTFSLSWDPPKK